jgi:large subunit ribosomal protein L6
MPIVLPAGVEATLADGQLAVKGPLGTLTQPMSERVMVSLVEKRLVFESFGE